MYVCMYACVCVCVCVCVCILSQQRRVLLKATEETGLKLNMDIAKHILHELHTEIKSALID